jgi:very-short-patch-repair endonuclease
MAYPDMMLAVEVEGGTWINGRHSRGAGMEKDMDKYNTAALDGWTVLRFTGNMIKSGMAIQQIQRAFEQWQSQESSF